MSSSGTRDPTGSELNAKLAEFAVAIALNPNDAQAHRNRGLFLARARRYDEAMRDFDAALAINPSDPHAHGLRGLVWEKRGDVKRALSDLEAAIAQAPESAHIYESHRKRLRDEPALGGDRSKNQKSGRSAVAGGSFNLLENPSDRTDPS
jgi:tetratricopeptide (TPR) repeat protein